jgi:hypothetical protein
MVVLETLKHSIYRFLQSLVYLTPLTILIIFVTLTLRNVTNRRVVGRRLGVIQPGVVENNRSPALKFAARLEEQRCNKNTQLLRLNLIQIFVYILLNVPSTIYAFITRTYQKNTDQIVIDGFINLMTYNLLYTYCAVRSD